MIVEHPRGGTIHWICSQIVTLWLWEDIISVSKHFFWALSKCPNISLNAFFHIISYCIFPVSVFLVFFPFPNENNASCIELFSCFSSSPLTNDVSCILLFPISAQNRPVSHFPSQILSRFPFHGPFPVCFPPGLKKMVSLTPRAAPIFARVC